MTTNVLKIFWVRLKPLTPLYIFVCLFMVQQWPIKTEELSKYIFNFIDVKIIYLNFMSFELCLVHYCYYKVFGNILRDNHQSFSKISVQPTLFNLCVYSDLLLFLWHDFQLRGKDKYWLSFVDMLLNRELIIHWRDHIVLKLYLWKDDCFKGFSSCWNIGL